MSAVKQLAFDLPHRTAYGREDFLVAGSNAHAIDMIDRWPDWPARIMALIGPPASGKTHLASVWQKKSGAQFIDDSVFSGAALPAFSTPLLIDALDKKIPKMPQENIFLFLNQAIHSGIFLLFTSSEPLTALDMIPDLRSRLCTAPVLTLNPPDEALIGAVMIKMFSDRQIDIPVSVIEFLLMRMERSFEAAHQIVKMIDQESMARRKPITIAIAREALSRIAF